MTDKNKELAKEFIRARPDSTMAKLVGIIGLDLFALLLVHPELQGRHVVFPRKTTLARILMMAKIKKEMKHLKPGSLAFEAKLKSLANTYGRRPHQIKRLLKSK